MWNCIRYLLVTLVILGVSGFCYAGGREDKGEDWLEGMEAHRKNPDTGEDELLNTEDGKYYKIVDKTEETEKLQETLTEEEKETNRNAPIPYQAGHGVWYYTSNITNPRSGNRYGIQCRMIVHTSGIYINNPTYWTWVYTPIHAGLPKSCEVLGRYIANANTSGETKLYVYDWSVASDRWKLIGDLNTLGNYKAWIDDGFGTLQVRLLVSNETRYIPSTQKWTNEVYLFNPHNNPASWDLKYSSVPYADYDLGINSDSKAWAGVLEYESTLNGGNNPPPLKEFGFIEIRRIFDGTATRMNTTSNQGFFSNFSPPNNTVVSGLIPMYTWRNGASTTAD